MDPVGRTVWSLDITADQGLSIDHRRQSYCTFTGGFDRSSLPLGPFPFVALPALLLDRVPAEPAQPELVAKLPELGGDIEFRDPAGRRWTASVEASGRLLSWTLFRRGEPSVWWRHYDDWSILSDRERGVQVRWREVLRETLERQPGPLEPPPGFRETPCGATESPDSGD